MGRHVSKAVVHVAQWKQGFWVYIGGLRLPAIGFLRQAGFSRSPHTCPGQADRGLQSGKINPEPSRSNPNTLQLGKSEKDRTTQQVILDNYCTSPLKSSKHRNCARRTLWNVSSGKLSFLAPGGHRGDAESCRPGCLEFSGTSKVSQTLSLNILLLVLLLMLLYYYNYDSKSYNLSYNSIVA